MGDCKVFISKRLPPAEAPRILRKLRKFEPQTTQASAISSASVVVAPREEVFSSSSQSPPFWITPLCIAQGLNPFKQGFQRNLVNLYLDNKSISLSHINGTEYNRLAKMIQLMSGRVSSRNFDYVLAREYIPDAQAILPSWIDNLFGSEVYITPDSFRVPKSGSLSCQAQRKLGIRSGCQPQLQIRSVPKRTERGTPLLDRVNSLFAERPRVPAPAKGQQLLLQVGTTAPKKDLDELCLALSKAKPRPARLVPEAAGGDQDALLSRLNQFSQVDDSQKGRGAFEIQYERDETNAEIVDDDDDRDPLFNLAVGSQLSQV